MGKTELGGHKSDHKNPTYDPNEDGVIKHPDLGSVTANQHHTRPNINAESDFFKPSGNTAGITSITFFNAYVEGLATAYPRGYTAGNQNSVDATIDAYNEDANGNIVGVDVKFDNETANSNAIRVRIIGEVA